MRRKSVILVGALATALLGAVVHATDFSAQRYVDYGPSLVITREDFNSILNSLEELRGRIEGLEEDCGKSRV